MRTHNAHLKNTLMEDSILLHLTIIESLYFFLDIYIFSEIYKIIQTVLHCRVPGCLSYGYRDNAPDMCRWGALSKMIQNTTDNGCQVRQFQLKRVIMAQTL